MESHLGVTNPTPTNMLALQELRCDDEGAAYPIGSLVGLEYAKNLKSLSLTGSYLITDIEPLKALSKLQTLELHCQRISDISPLWNLPSLVYLDLASNLVQDPRLNFTGPLQHLDLSWNPIANVATTNLPKLTYLDLSGTQITQIPTLSGLPALTAKVTNLVTLNLSGNLIEDVNGLSGMQKLSRVNLANNRLSDVRLTDVPALSYLDLSGNQVGDAGVLARLASLPVLWQLVLSDNPLGAMTVPAAPVHFPRLRTLILSRSQIGGMRTLTSLMRLPALETLDLSDNQIRNCDGLADLSRRQCKGSHRPDGTGICPEPVHAPVRPQPDHHLGAPGHTDEPAQVDPQQ